MAKTLPLIEAIDKDFQKRQPLYHKSRREGLGRIFDVALDHDVPEGIRIKVARVAVECLGCHPEYNRELAPDLLATFESPSAKVRDAVAECWLAMKENDPSSACRAHVVVAQRILADNPKLFFRKPEIGPA